MSNSDKLKRLITAEKAQDVVEAAKSENIGLIDLKRLLGISLGASGLALDTADIFEALKQNDLATGFSGQHPDPAQHTIRLNLANWKALAEGKEISRGAQR